jgi:hypothetical protein
MKRKSFILIIVLIAILLLASLLYSCSDDSEANRRIIDVSIHGFPHNIYYVRTSLNLSGAYLLVTYSDDSTELVAITNDMVSGFDSSKPISELTIQITYNNFVNSLVVSIIDDLITGISLVSLTNEPIVFNVRQGDTLDFTNILLRRTLKSGNTVDVEVDLSTMVTGYTTTTPPGEYIAKITYDNFSVNFTVNVQSNRLLPSETSIAVPTKKSYFLDDTEFDPTGLVFHFTYEDYSTTSVAYTEENKDDFEFQYNLGVERKLSPVTVKYTGDLVSDYTEEFIRSFNIEVRSPLCLGMVFTYVNESGETIDGTPKTNGIKINDEVYIEPSSINAVVEGDIINWESGSALVSYENGKTIIVKLNDPIVQRYNQTDGSSDVDTSIIGNHIVWFKYGNVTWQVMLNIVVIPRAPRTLLLENTEYLTEPTFAYGTILVYNLVIYNVLFNNGEYLFFDGYELQEASSFNTYQKRNIADKSEWRGVSIDMLTGTSNLTVNEDSANDGIQTIEFRYLDVKASFNIKVDSVKVIGISIIREPIKNCYQQGTSVEDNMDYSGGIVLLNFNNGTYTTVNMQEDSLTKKVVNKNGEEVSNLNDECKVLVYHNSNESAQDFFYVGVHNINYQGQLGLLGVPLSINFIDFEKIPFKDIYFTLLVWDDQQDSYVETKLKEVDKSEDIYSADTNKIGYQVIMLRYLGLSVDMQINITGKRVSAFEIISAPQIIYIAGIDTEISFDNLKVKKLFNDQSTPEEVIDFNFDTGEWSYDIINKDKELSNLHETGEKTVTLYYSIDYPNGKVQIAFSYVIYVLEADSITNIEVKDNNVDSRLTVLRGDELNLYGLELLITYKQNDSFYNATTTLLRSYVEYDPNVKYIEIAKTEIENPIEVPVIYHELVVRFPKTELQTKLYIMFSDKKVVNIEVESYPTIKEYPINAELSLAGGVLKRYFEGGGYDFISMTNSSVYYEGYVLDPFDTAIVAFVEQKVRLIYNNVATNDPVETEIFIKTYRKLNAGDTLILQNTISYYGTKAVPTATLHKTADLDHFVLPAYSLYYQTEAGDWVLVNEASGDYPIRPGTYQLKVSVIENAYYAGGDIQNHTVTILRKSISISIQNAQKVYRALDPLFTYQISTTALVEINGVRDRIELELYRDSGENVLYNDGGMLVGYAIHARTTGTGNQNDYYIFQVEEGSLIINPYEIEGLIFYGYLNLKTDGSNKVITAYYQAGYNQIPVSASDIVYSVFSYGAYEVMAQGIYPVSAGQYRASLSNNYKVKNGLANYVDFAITN